MHHSRYVRLAIAVGAVAVNLAAIAPCRGGLIVPGYSSRPGAAYTVYLDFGGFAFTGTWGGTGRAPGVTPAYTVDSDATSYSDAELANIRVAWARTAEKYSSLNVNVTTVDPAVAAGQASTDASRQAYYDATARVEHTVVSGNGSWYGNAGGVSYAGVIKNAYGTSNNGGAGAGWHTNWVFAGLAPTNLQYIGEAAAHENGHSFGLSHQSDYGTNGNVTATGTTLINEYSSNGNGTGGGDGTFAPVMGVSYYTQRGLWRSGSTDLSGSRATQDDFAIIGANPGMTLLDDGIGHTMATATWLPLDGLSPDPAYARGNISPISLASPNPIGSDNYTKDYFRFSTNGSGVTFTCWDGSEYITAGVADAGATLASTLKVYDLAGALMGTAVGAANTLSETYNGVLPAGDYYLEVADAGGLTSAWDPTASYYTGGSYFITGVGSYITVPEPSALAALLGPLLLISRRRR